MQNEIRWLKISFLAGIIMDVLIGIYILIPGKIGETEFRYPTEFAAFLMLSWALLLVWGYRKPMERKGVLVLTIFPVNVGIIIAGILSVISNIFTLMRVLPVMIVEAVLIALFTFSLINALKLEESAE